MRVTKVRLRNVYQHQNVDIDITGSRIALVGPNGGGKSNFMLAIGEAIHGEYHQNKERVVTWGKESGESYVELLLAGGKRLAITRRFPTGGAELDVFLPDGGKENITGPTKVNERILVELQTDKSILQNIVFVGQTEIDDVLFAKASEKDRLAQRFFGLQAANVLEKAITKSMGSIMIDSFADMLPSLLESRGNLSQEINRLEQELDGCKSLQDLASDVQSLDAKIRDAGELNLKIQAYRALAEARINIHARYSTATSEYAEAYKSYQAVDIETAKANLARDRKIQDIRTQASRLESKQKEFSERIQLLGARPFSKEHLDQLDAEIQKLIAERDPLVAEETAKKQALGKIGTNSTCPTCGQPVDISGREPIAASLIAIGNKLAEINPRIHGLIDRHRKELTACSKWDGDTQAMNYALEDVNKQLSVVAKEMSDIGPAVHEVPNPDYWFGIVSSHTATGTALSQQHAGLSKLNEEIQNLDAKIAAYQNSVLDENSRLRSPVSVQELQDELQVKRTEQMRVHQLITTLEDRRRSKTSCDDQINKARLAMATNRASEDIKRIFTSARAAFHPDGAPKTLVERSTKMLEGRINHYLQAMKAKFQISAREGLSFNCHFPEGIGLDTELSVGQRVVLSWAFRLAACETFSSTVGLMTMDEPTAALDTRTSEAFLDIMEAMRDLADKFGMQFFIATHSESLARTCDQTISVNGPEN